MSYTDLTLSWEAAALAIVLTALPAVLHPSGRVLGFPSSYGFILRCSPLVCAASVTDTFFRNAMFRKQRYDGVIPFGFDDFIGFRYYDYYDEKAKRLDLASVHFGRRVLNLLFIFGALPQAVKIFMTEGIPWALQATCAAYVVSYLVDDLILEIAIRRKAQARPRALPEGALPLRWAGILIHYALLLTIFAAHEAMWRFGDGPVPNMLKSNRYTWTPLSLVVSSVAAFIASLWVLGDDSKILVFCSCLHLLLIPFGVRVFIGEDLRFELPIFCSMLPAAGGISLGMAKLAERLSRSQYGKLPLHVCLGAYLLLVQVLAARAYFTFGYDGYKTAVPSWIRANDPSWYIAGL